MALILNKVSKRFNDIIILESFSYSFNQNGIYIVMGESGVGKTTLLRLIAGLDRDYEGEIIGGGFENTSMMFQEYRLFPSLNMLDNALVSVNEPKENDIKCAKKLLNRLYLDDDAFIKRPSELSGGMKQRIAFVRAVMKSSPILLLDEPTKELNAEIIDEMVKIIAEEAENRLVLLVSHEDLSKHISKANIIQI